MSGITGTMAANAASNIVEVSALSTGDAAGALESIGLGHIAVGTGNSTSNDYHVALGYTHADDASVIQVTNAWKTKSGDPLTFNGNNITSLASEGVEAVIALYVSPTVNWASGQEGGNSWAKAVKEYSLDVVGKNPLADNDEFNYYIAYIGLLPNGVYKATTTATGVYLHPTGTLSGAKSEAEEHLEDAGWEVDDDDWVDDTNGGSTAGLVGIAGGAHVGKTAIVTITFDDTPSAKLLGITDSDCEPINP
ncbi:MAG: hypothetical protein LBJ67_05425 [Planctomycetaceae bacterium]|nr:hypothetical protein [Planctomycetaceae bacterium]